MSGSVRIINLLGHYRDRLRNKGVEGQHEEELDYLVSILESPFMKDFLQGKMSREDTDHFNEVTSQVISALEEQEEERHLSPETQRKRQLRRRASLRALKLAVTPQPSPRITPKNSQGTLIPNTSNESPLLQSVMATLSSRESSRENTPAKTTPPPSVDSLPDGNHDNKATPTKPPMLPSYKEVLNMRRRTKSYEKLPTPVGSTTTSVLPSNGISVILNKSEKGLGFSVAKQRGSQGVIIRDIQPGGVAERDGRIRKGDQIVSINGQNILNVSHPTVVALLQQAQGNVELTIIHNNSNNNNGQQQTMIPQSTNPSLQTRPHPFATPLPSVQKLPPPSLARRDSQQLAVIKVRTNDINDLGFSIISKDGATFIHLVSHDTNAKTDGELYPGDQILSIDGCSTAGMTHSLILDKLQGIAKLGQTFRLVVSRVAMETQEDDSFSDIDSSSDNEEISVELIKSSGGLGISINALVNDDTEEDKGIYIRGINSNGPAGLSGLVKRKDRIIGVNDVSLKGMSNMEAANILRNAGNSVKLILERRKSVHHIEEEEEEEEESKPEQLVDSSEDEESKETDIITAFIEKADSEKGLGFKMESIAVVDDTGQTQIGSVRHVIKTIAPGGPMDLMNLFQIGDEIIEVDGHHLVGMSHDRAIDIVRQASDHVKIIVSRNKTTSNHSNDVSSETSQVPGESEDDHVSSNMSTSPALQAIYDNFSRRFERQSWRERHNEETRRLKERFEIRREQYNRFLKEQEDELLRVEKETAQRRVRQHEEEEKHKQETENKRSSLQSGLHYSYYAPMSSFLSLHESAGEEEERGEEERGEERGGDRQSMGSEESSTSVLSPVPGCAWETESTIIELIKEKEGLGFSILDFADSSSPGDRVILVHSLVTGGTAERDGRLKKGDKLISVNGVSVINHSLEFTVEELKSVPLNDTVRLCIHHALPVSPCSTSSDGMLYTNNNSDEDYDYDKEDRKKKTVDGSKDDSPHEDDEPPPPYTEVDPLEKGKKKTRSVTPDESPHTAPLPPLLRTRSDEPTAVLAAATIPSSNTVVTAHNLRQVESTSEETLVGSSSHQDLHLVTTTNFQPSPKTHNSPVVTARAIPPPVIHKTATALPNNVYSPSQSQDSIIEGSGLSPDTSDTGDHSAEMDTEPRDIDIKKGTAHLGMAVMEDKGFIIVKKIESGSVLAKDGRIRVGDRILAINGKSVEGLSLAKVKSMLKRASSAKSTKVKITYLPVPQGFSSMGYTAPHQPAATTVDHSIKVSSQEGPSYHSTSTSSGLPLRQIQSAGAIPHRNMMPAGYQWPHPPPPPPLQYIPPYMEHHKPHPPPPYDIYRTTGHMYNHWNMPPHNTTWSSSNNNYGYYDHHTVRPLPQYPPHHDYYTSFNQMGGGATNERGEAWPVISNFGNSKLIEVKRNAVGSLGISLGSVDGGGVVVNAVSPACQSMTKGQLLPGDRILEVNGIDLRGVSQADAINIMMNAGNPVVLLVQNYNPFSAPPPPPPLPVTNSTVKKRVHTSPLHSNDGSWAVDEEEDEDLRQIFPNANGHLYQVTLNKGQKGLGLSICKVHTAPHTGVNIMQIQPGGVADQTKRIKRGDELIQVNEHCILGWSQKDVSDLLSRTSQLVKLILIRPLPDPTRLTHQLSSHSLEQNQPSVDLTGLPLVKAVTLERDDELGLGFTVSECDFNEQNGVQITSINPGGPASKEGQLSVGDYILSIDGHNVLGIKFEKVTHLLQQARSRGLVSLIVSSSVQLPLHDSDNKSPRKTKNSPEKRLRVRSEGITLRNRVTKAQRSTRRRPVSVDCEMSYKDTDALVHDVELLTSSTTDTSIVEGVATDIEIYHGTDPLGVSVIEQNGGVVIQSITPKSPASIDGRLQIGDQLLKIGDIPLNNVSCRYVHELLLEGPPLLQLTVYRTGSDVETVELIKPDNGGLGLMILDDEEEGGVIIDQVVHGEVAQASGRIHGGDKLLAINREDIRTAPLDLVRSLLQNCRGLVSITVRHNKEQRTENYSPLIHTSPDPTNGTFQYRDVVGQNMRSEPRPPPTTGYSSYHQDQPGGKIKRVTITRGPAGLGFSVAGGKGSPNGDLPICIRSISNDCQAARDGRIKQGDIILSVNGVSFNDITHKRAVDTLTRSQGDIILTIHSP